jgi:osmotically-inducible protein OsmY
MLIEVKLPVTEERNVEDIAAAAIQALEWDAAVPFDKIRVTVAKAWVTLEGEVECLVQGRASSDEDESCAAYSDAL